MGIINFPGNVSVYELKIGLGQPAISSDKQGIDFPYKGYADPASSTVALAKYQYSLDNGVTYSDMTPVSAADISDLSFNPSGNDLVFHWDAKIDLGDNLYNVPFRVLFQAAEYGLTSTEISRYVVFERTTTNVAALRAKKVFPDNYNGTSGSEFLQGKIPKSG